MGIFDGDGEEPNSKIRRYIVTSLILLLLLSGGIWYIFRYHTEKKTVEKFLTTVASGNLQEAYRLWQENPNYTFEDFVEDWGPQGYYGPVKSFLIDAADSDRGSSGVVVIVELSPDAPFPGQNEKEKFGRLKEARLWVDGKSQAISFAPPPNH